MLVSYYTHTHTHTHAEDAKCKLHELGKQWKKQKTEG